MIRVVTLGTGTDVGKTWVGVALVRTAQARGLTSLGLKPWESGIETSVDALAHSDAGRLRAASSACMRGDWATSGLPAAGASALHLQTFQAPISPHLAARNAGSRLDLALASKWVERHENDMTLHVTSNEGFLLVETAGGVFSPLTERDFNFDLAQVLSPAKWVLVCPDRLGVLHDLAATLLAMAARGRIPDVIALSDVGATDASVGHNEHEIRDTLPQLLGWKPSLSVTRVSRGQHDVGELLDHLIGAP